MEIQVAKSAGFCFGVKRAVEQAYSLAREQGKQIVTLGPIIHNEQVIMDLEAHGVFVVNSPEEIKPGSLVIIRAHGVGPDVYQFLEENNLEYVDLTCPYVKKIHKIVEEKHHAGRKIVVIGKKDHPEVIGINGWCEKSAIILYEEEINEKLAEKFKNINKISIVAQTTINQTKFYNYIKFLKNTCNDIEVFDTICSATSERQQEALSLAANADVMIVVGGLQSSNSFELYNRCKEVCHETYLIQTPDELSNIDYENKRVAITAGASTPAYIIKEVLNIMSEEKTMPITEEKTENFADMLENYLNSSIHSGQVIKGTVDRVSANEINVNIPGYKGVGVISLDNLTDDPQLKPEECFKVGDEIEAMVIKKNDVEGTVELSKKRVDSFKNSEVIRDAFEKQEIVTGKVVEINKGGLAALVNSFKVFVPNSLATERYTEDISFLQNTEVSLKIIDFDDKKRRAVGSIKAVLLEEKRKLQNEFWESVSEGKVYQGIVKSLTNFGAFVDLGGVDGLVHISELSWGRIKHPSEVVKVGELLEVYVKELDRENKKISLGFKKAEDNPWVKVQNEIKVNDVIECKIVRLVPFGAFAEIAPFVDGLIHISQISDKRIGKPADVLKIGDVVQAKVIEMDVEKQKISLSIRALLDEAPVLEESATEDAPVDIEAYVKETATEEETKEATEE